MKPLINISPRQAYLFAVFLVLYEFLTYISNDMIMPGMIHVVHSFRAPETDIALSLSLYVLGGASLQIILGPLSDRYGRRPVMLFGVCFFLLCTIFIALSASMHQFLIARYFQGMGLCFIGVVGYATIQEIFAERDAVRLIAIMSNVSILAPLLGPSIGALIVHFTHWRNIFISISIFCILAFWGLWKFMPEAVGQTKSDGVKIDPVNLDFKTMAANYKLLLCNKSFMLGATAIGVSLIPCMAWIALAPIILVSEAKLSVLTYGVWQIPIFGASIAGNLILVRVARFYTVKPIIRTGTIFCVTSLLILFLLPVLMGSKYIWLMPGLIGYYFSLGLIGAPLSRFVLFSTPVSKGTASALMSLITMIIQAVGIYVMNIIYLSHDNYRFALACSLFGLIYAGLVMFGVYNRQSDIVLKNK